MNPWLRNGGIAARSVVDSRRYIADRGGCAAIPLGIIWGDAGTVWFYRDSTAASRAIQGVVAALEGAERFALPPPPAIASVGTQEPMVRRLFPGGNGPPTNDQAKKSGAVTPRDTPVVRGQGLQGKGSTVLALSRTLCAAAAHPR